MWTPLAAICAARSPGRAAVVGWGHGVALYALVLASLPTALRAAAGASVAVGLASTVLLAAYEGGRLALVALVAARAVRNGWSLLLAFPVALATSESWYPVYFPVNTGLFLGRAPTVLLQAADLAGPSGITLWVGLLCASVAVGAVRGQSAKRRLAHLVVIPGCVLAVVVAYGTLSERRADAISEGAPEATIALVQGNMTKREHNATAIKAYRDTTLDTIAGRRVDLVVWPETAITKPVDETLVLPFMAANVYSTTQRAGGPAVEVPVLTGMVLRRSRFEDASAELWNSAVLTRPDSRVVERYDKRRLMMFGEYWPRVWPIAGLRNLMPKADELTPGQSSALFSLDGHGVLPLICLEDVLPDAVRRDVAERSPELLVAIDSDAWFGVSDVPYWHLAVARLRAIEHRRFFVRAANTGVSAVVDPAGREVMTLPAFERGGGVANIRWLRTTTVYQRLGGALRWLLLGLTLAVAFFRRPYRQRAAGGVRTSTPSTARAHDFQPGT